MDCLMPEKEPFILKIYVMKCVCAEYRHKMSKYGHCV